MKIIIILIAAFFAVAVTGIVHKKITQRQEPVRHIQAPSIPLIDRTITDSFIHNYAFVYENDEGKCYRREVFVDGHQEIQIDVNFSSGDEGTIIIDKANAKEVNGWQVIDAFENVLNERVKFSFKVDRFEKINDKKIYHKFSIYNFHYNNISHVQ